MSGSSRECNTQHKLDAANHSAAEAERGGNEIEKWGQAPCAARMARALHQPDAAARSSVGAGRGQASERATNPNPAMFTLGSMPRPPGTKAERGGDERRIVGRMASRRVEGHRPHKENSATASFHENR